MWMGAGLLENPRGAVVQTPGKSASTGLVEWTDSGVDVLWASVSRSEGVNPEAGHPSRRR